MPRRMVLVREAGGLPKTGIGSTLSWPRFDVRCYGKEPGGVWDASDLSRTIYDRLFGRHNMVSGPGGDYAQRGAYAWPRSGYRDGPIICARMTCLQGG